MHICLTCKKEFEPRHANHKYCSATCKPLSYTKTCHNCGKSFGTKSRTQSYCSMACRPDRSGNKPKKPVPVLQSKVCRTCKKEKSASDFYLKTDGRLFGNCKPCYLAALAEKKKGIPQEQKAISRRIQLMKSYGITLEDYMDLDARQKSCCAICNMPEKEGKVLAVDHDHKTGAVRGLLCNNCNRALGHFKDSEVYLANALKYIGKFK